MTPSKVMQGRGTMRAAWQQGFVAIGPQKRNLKRMPRAALSSSGAILFKVVAQAYGVLVAVTNNPLPTKGSNNTLQYDARNTPRWTFTIVRYNDRYQIAEACLALACPSACKSRARELINANAQWRTGAMSLKWLMLLLWCRRRNSRFR